MNNLRKMIGTPSAIVAFEAAGRHLNFTRAAEELNVSQPAISRQIRNLELHIGQNLFHRRGNQIGFTPEGRVLFNATSSSFTQIVSAVEDIRSSSGDDALVLRSVPIVFSTYILPYYQDLQRSFPGTPVDMRAVKNAVPDELDRPSVSILYGTGQWQGVESELILEDICFPMGHPVLLENLKQATPQQTFERLPLLQLSSYYDDWMDWHTWGAQFHIECLSKKRPQYYNDYDMLLQACRSGHGLGIGSLYLIGQSLQEGTLVRVSDLCVRAKFGFYLVYNRQIIADENYVKFLNWIRRTANEIREKYLPLVSDFME